MTEEVIIEQGIITKERPATHEESAFDGARRFLCWVDEPDRQGLIFSPTALTGQERDFLYPLWYDRRTGAWPEDWAFQDWGACSALPIRDQEPIKQ